MMTYTVSAHADKEYHALLDSTNRFKNAESDDYDTTTLAEAAALLSLMEEWEESIELNPSSRAKFQPFLDQAKTEV
jgi:hypothetical protein